MKRDHLKISSTRKAPPRFGVRPTRVEETKTRYSRKQKHANRARESWPMPPEGVVIGQGFSDLHSTSFRSAA